MRWWLRPRGKSRTADLSWAECCDVEMCHGGIGALNDRYDWVANALGLTFVDPNNRIGDMNFARDGLRPNGSGKRWLGQLYARDSGLDIEGSTGSRMSQILENGNYSTKDTRENDDQRSKNIRLNVKKMDQWLVSWRVGKLKWGQVLDIF
jgi:hypothetical protein